VFILLFSSDTPRGLVSSVKKLLQQQPNLKSNTSYDAFLYLLGTVKWVRISSLVILVIPVCCIHESQRLVSVIIKEGRQKMIGSIVQIFTTFNFFLLFKIFICGNRGELSARDRVFIYNANNSTSRKEKRKKAMAQRETTTSPVINELMREKIYKTTQLLKILSL